MAKQCRPVTRVGGSGVRRPNRQLEIEHLPIARIRPDPRPQRKHGERQLTNLEGAICQFGIVAPILIDDDDVIIDGHAVLEAAKRLGIETIPVVRAGGLTKHERRALSMALNRIGELASWDLDVLRADFITLQASPDIDFSLDLTGFDQVFRDTATLDLSFSNGEEEDPLADDSPIVTRRGDLWRCGQHAVICADSREPLTYEAIMAGELARMVFGDTPYNIKIANNVSGLGKVKHGEFAAASGEMSRPEFVEFQRVIFQLCASVTVDGGLHYYFIDWRHVRDQIEAGEAVFGALKQLIVWAKPNSGMGTFYRSRHELLTVWKVGDAPNLNNFELGGTGRHRSNVWDYPGYSSFGAGREEALSWHPTTKPVAMIMDAILDVTLQGEIVLDPFGGSGTTMIACQRTHRVARLIEIDPKYVDVTLRRFMAETGEEPVLASLGQPFSRVREQRVGAVASADEDNIDWSL